MFRVQILKLLKGYENVPENIPGYGRPLMHEKRKEKNISNNSDEKIYNKMNKNANEKTNKNTNTNANKYHHK